MTDLIDIREAAKILGRSVAATHSLAGRDVIVTVGRAKNTEGPPKRLFDRKQIEEYAAACEEKKAKRVKRKAKQPQKAASDARIAPLTASEKKVILKAYNAGTLTPFSPHFNRPLWLAEQVAA